MSSKKICLKCGREGITVIRGRHEFLESGLNNIILMNVEIKKCDNCGEKVISIPNSNQLVKVIGEQIILKPNNLAGQEIRFLRKNIYLKIQEFAQMLGVTRGTVSRWENGKINPKQPEDRLIRLIYAECADVSAPIKDRLMKMLREEALSGIDQYTWICDVPQLTCLMNTA